MGLAVELGVGLVVLAVLVGVAVLVGIGLIARTASVQSRRLVRHTVGRALPVPLAR